MSKSKLTPKRVLKNGAEFESMTRIQAAALLHSWHVAARASMNRGYKLVVERTSKGTEYQFSGRGTNPAPLFVPRLRPTRKAEAKAAFAAAYGVSSKATMQELADGQRRRIAAGLSYGYALSSDISPAQVLALMQIKDTLRRVGMAAVADGHGRVVFIRREVGDQRELAYSTFV